jgi:flagellar hook-length control protein FliK
MGIDMTNFAPAAAAGAGCSCGQGSPASNPAEISFERLVELAFDGSAAGASNPSLESAAGQPGPQDSALRAAPNPAAQQATAAGAAIPWQPTPTSTMTPWWATPGETKASRKSDSGDPPSPDDDGATDQAQSSGGPEDSWAALLAATAIAVNPAEPPLVPAQEAPVGGQDAIGDGSLDEKAPGMPNGSDEPAARPPQTGDRIAVPVLDANAEAADADPKVSGWAERAEQNLPAGPAQPTPAPTAAGSDPAAPSDLPQSAERAARTPPSRADLTQNTIRNTPGAASTDQGRTDGQLEAASHLAIRAMLERALTTDNAQRSEVGERPDAASAAGHRPTAGTSVVSSTPGLADLFQVPAEEAVRRYAELLAAQAPAQRDAKVVDSGAPRGQKDTAAGDFTRAFSFAALAANPTAAGAPASAEPAPAGTPVEAPLTPQIVKAVSLIWRDGVGEARLRLEPEHLGSVTVSLRVERGIVTARMTADVPAVRDWIRTHEADLRNSLASQGLELDQIVVSADPDDRNRQPPPDSNRQPRTPRTSRGGPQFQLNA